MKNSTNSEKYNEHIRLMIQDTIINVIDQFKFPDGCLDLSGDDLDDFILTLRCEIFNLFKEE